VIKIRNKFLDSYPVIFHHNGRRNLFKNSSAYPLKGKVFEYFSEGEDTGFFMGRKEKLRYNIPKKKESCDPIFDDLTIVMISNLTEYGSAARSLEYYGIPYVVVGEEILKFDGWEKFKKVMEFIPTVKTKYLMLLDSDDVFIVDGMERVMNYEKDMDCKMLFNAEGWSFPKGNTKIDEFEKSVIPKDVPFKHLNSGVWIANMEFLNSVYDVLAKIEPFAKDDGCVFKELYKMFYPQIKIDYECKLFQSVPWTPWFEQHYPGRMDMELIIE